MLCETQSVLSRVWTRVTVFISYDDNHYTTGTSINCNDDFNNERIHFFIKIWISHTLFLIGWCLFCVRGELETGTDCYIDPSSSRDHSSSSSSSWLGLLNHGSLRAQSPLSAAGSHFGILSPTDSNCLGTLLYYCLTSTCFRCSFAYLHWCISWLTARSRVNI